MGATCLVVHGCMILLHLIYTILRAVPSLILNLIASNMVAQTKITSITHGNQALATCLGKIKFFLWVNKHKFKNCVKRCMSICINLLKLIKLYMIYLPTDLMVLIF